MVEKHEVFAKKYWAAADLKKPVVLEIEAVNVEVLKARDGSTSQKPVAYFRGTTKRLAVNATNFDLLVDITGEPDSDSWIGHAVELYASTTSMAGSMVPCVRVRAPSKAKAKAKAPPPMSDESEGPADGIEFA
jgi:hypothetical protein